MSRPSVFKRARVGVAPGAEVQLLRPALLGVEMAEEYHHVRCERLALCPASPRVPRGPSRRSTVACGIGAVGRVALIEAVIRQPSADVVERLMALAQRVEQILELRDVRRSRSAASLSIQGLKTSG